MCADRDRNMHGPSVHLVLGDEDGAAGQKDVPELTLLVESAEVPRLKMDKMRCTWPVD